MVRCRGGVLKPGYYPHSRIHPEQPYSVRTVVFCPKSHMLSEKSYTFVVPRRDTTYVDIGADLPNAAVVVCKRCRDVWVPHGCFSRARSCRRACRWGNFGSVRLCRVANCRRLRDGLNPTVVVLQIETGALWTDPVDSSSDIRSRP